MNSAASNAANGTPGPFIPTSVGRFSTWPNIEKFDNDTSTTPSSPFGGVANPDDIWQPGAVSAGQQVNLAIANTTPIVVTDSTFFSVFLTSFCDNANFSQIQVFNLIGDTYFPLSPQPTGLGGLLLQAGDPNNPAVGVTEPQPFSFQDVRVYSTRFALAAGTYRIVLSFEGVNYFPTDNNNLIPNPAGVQFLLDIYSNS